MHIKISTREIFYTWPGASAFDGHGPSSPYNRSNNRAQARQNVTNHSGIHEPNLHFPEKGQGRVLARLETRFTGSINHVSRKLCMACIGSRQNTRAILWFMTVVGSVNHMIRYVSRPSISLSLLGEFLILQFVCVVLCRLMPVNRDMCREDLS